MDNVNRVAPGPKTGALLTATAAPYAVTGIKQSDAETKGQSTSTNVPVVQRQHTEPRIALLQRRLKPLTPLVADCWLLTLNNAHLLPKYPQILSGL